MRWACSDAMVRAAVVEGEGELSIHRREGEGVGEGVGEDAYVRRRYREGVMRVRQPECGRWPDAGCGSGRAPTRRAGVL